VGSRGTITLRIGERVRGERLRSSEGRSPNGPAIGEQDSARVGAA
jgi:hypothetical protein